MFSVNQTKSISNLYFNVINVSAFTVTVQSKNTGHYWHITEEEYPSYKTCIIYHKHKYEDAWHRHGAATTLKKAIGSIKDHDTFQLHGRKHST